MSQDNHKLRLAIADKFTNNCQIALSDEGVCKKILSQCEHYLNSYIKFLVPPQESCCARLGELLKDYNLEFAFPDATHFQAASFGDEESGKDEDEAPTTPLVKAYASPKFFSFAEVDETQPAHKKIGFAPTAKEAGEDEDAILASRAASPVVLKSAFLGGATTPSSEVVFLPEPPAADLRKKTPVTPPIRSMRPKYTTQVSTVSQKSNTINLYSCWPPPIGIILISLVELILFIVNEKKPDNSGRFSHGIIADYLMFDPYRRKEFWRFISYHLVHIGVQHLLFNLCVQIFLGVILEMVHERWRVLTIYFAGILAGSLGTSVFNPRLKLAGASGGVYALITAHIVTVILKWKHLPYPASQLLIFLIIIVADFSTFFHSRSDDISYVAHGCGAMAGLLVGFQILRKLSADKKIRWFQYVGFVTLVLFVIFAVCWNIWATKFFPIQFV